MTGSDIREIRKSLGMSVPEFTDLIGVAISTMYRWEATVGEIAMEGHPARLLALMYMRMVQGDRSAAVVAAIEGTNGLVRLHRLLGVLLG